MRPFDIYSGVCASIAAITYLVGKRRRRESITSADGVLIVWSLGYFAVLRCAGIFTGTVWQRIGNPPPFGWKWGLLSVALAIGLPSAASAFVAGLATRSWLVLVGMLGCTAIVVFSTGGIKDEPPLLILSFFLIAPAVWWPLGTFGWVVPLPRRSLEGHCAKCGYDLVGTTGDVCPECGTVTTGSDASQPR